jgi:chaperonin cofactor prefoldin
VNNLSATKHSTALAKLEERKSALTASIETVTWQINSLENFYSKQQVRCWKINRAKLNGQLKKLKRDIKKLESK